tara:strand:+ start:289 stop:477 length:189 start_codon:yes stop_codon:yes gene_type:complete
MIETFFIFSAYVVGTIFGWYVGRSSGMKQAIVDTVDQLIDQGYLKYKGTKSNPEILRHDESY